MEKKPKVELFKKFRAPFMPDGRVAEQIVGLGSDVVVATEAGKDAAHQPTHDPPHREH